MFLGRARNILVDSNFASPALRRLMKKYMKNSKMQLNSLRIWNKFYYIDLTRSRFSPAISHLLINDLAVYA